MHIRTFRAASLQDALEDIRRQMGPDASVLHTRQVRDGWMGWLGRTYVEVTAGLRDQSESLPSVPAAAGLSPRDVDSRLASTAVNSSGDSPVPAGTVSGVPPATSARAESALRVFGEPALPTLWQNCHQALLHSGVEPDVARRWIDATASFATSLGEQAESNWLEHLQRTVARDISTCGPIRTPPGDRRVVALVGPTGVGKTTTIAKLAAGFRIQARRRVGLVTIDTFRIAAVQQLKAYAEIMDLPMEVVEKPMDMQSAMDRLGDVDLVLIDTAGRSPRSDARIEQLVELLSAAKPDETHLVLSATSSSAAIQATLDGFAPIRPTAAILTKLDETPYTAGVISGFTAAPSTNGVPLSYLTNGQQVPDDITIADQETLLSRLLPARVPVSALDAA